eukprot:ANDGO_03348.mRNA.1 hypothetical protein
MLEVSSQIQKTLMSDEYWVRIVEPFSVSPVRIECLERAVAYDIAKGTLKEALNSDAGAHNVLVFDSIATFERKGKPLPADFRTAKLKENNSALNPLAVVIKTGTVSNDIPFTSTMEVTLKKPDPQEKGDDKK